MIDIKDKNIEIAKAKGDQKIIGNHKKMKNIFERDLLGKEKIRKEKSLAIIKGYVTTIRENSLLSMIIEDKRNEYYKLEEQVIFVKEMMEIIPQEMKEIKAIFYI